MKFHLVLSRHGLNLLWSLAHDYPFRYVRRPVAVGRCDIQPVGAGYRRKGPAGAKTRMPERSGLGQQIAEMRVADQRRPRFITT